MKVKAFVQSGSIKTYLPSTEIDDLAMFERYVVVMAMSGKTCQVVKIVRPDDSQSPNLVVQGKRGELGINHQKLKEEWMVLGGMQRLEANTYQARLQALKKIKESKERDKEVDKSLGREM